MSRSLVAMIQAARSRANAASTPLDRRKRGLSCAAESRPNRAAVKSAASGASGASQAAASSGATRRR